jgi:hypothetical protein
MMAIASMKSSVRGWERPCAPARHGTDTHKEAPLKSAATLELGNGFSQNRPDREERRRKRSKSENLPLAEESMSVIKYSDVLLIIMNFSCLKS